MNTRAGTVTPNLARLPGWRAALAVEVEVHRRRPFAWGSEDCALFAADCVRAMTGVDLAEALRGRYRSQKGAGRVLAAAGFGNVAELLAASLNEIPPAFAGVGDLAVIAGPAGPSVGIVIGGLIAARAADGIASVPLARASQAFRIGD